MEEVHARQAGRHFAAFLVHIFIGSRPLVGYYLEFDVAMVERALCPLLGQA